jgi:hypothetical protein
MIVDYECPQCLYTFESPRGVVRHMEKVHGSKPKRQMDYGGIDYLCEGKKKFPCEYCHKDFASKQKVKQHINEMTCLTSKKAPRKERNLNEELKGVQESATEALATGPNDAGEALLSITACHEKGQLSAQEALKMVSAVCRGDEIITFRLNKRAVRTYEAIVHGTNETFGYVEDPAEVSKGTNLVVPIYMISSVMCRQERMGTGKVKFGTEGSPLPLDQIVYKTFCTTLDGEEIKIYSNALHFHPPELAENCWCDMAFFNVKRSLTSKTSYVSINKDGGWIIYDECQKPMRAQGNVCILEWQPDQQDFVTRVTKSFCAKYATVKSFKELSTMTTKPWVTFPLYGKSLDQISFLNSEQSGVAKYLIKCIDLVNFPYENVDRSKTNFHFINGLPGTGKSFLLNALYFYCKAKGINSKVVAFTKMVANMYAEGSTIHSYFGIPFKRGKVEPANTVGEPTKSNLYSIYNLRVLFIDEICCVRKILIKVIDDCLRKYHNASAKFGGILIISAGDFNQLPPVNTNYEKDEALQEESFSSMPVFNEAKLYVLETPCRVYTSGHPDGGLISLMHSAIYDKVVNFDDEIILDDINKGIEFVYGKPEDWLGSFAKNNAIICLTNSNTFEVNTLILATLRKQPQKTIKSLTKLNKEPKNKEDAIKMMNVISPSLLVKGIPLFCNKNTKDGLVNGTRFTYDAMMTGERGGQRLCVSELDSAKNKSYSVAIGKGNYPFDWGFSITVHKAQGRTFDRVCLVLLEDAPFVHGQLTVALTRVRSMKDLRVVTKSKKCENVVDNAIREVAENIRKQAINK